MIAKRHFRKFLMTLVMLVLTQGCGQAVSNTPVLDSSGTMSVVITETPAATNTAIRSATQLLPSATLEVEGQVDLSKMTVDEWASTSPDGAWVAAGLVAFPKENIGGQQAYIRLMIFSIDGKTHWVIIDEWQEIGLGFPSPVPLQWSKDGKYFYFTHRVTPDGCSAFPFLTDLQQVNLQNGILETLLPDPALALALSPDDSQVAYFSGGLILRDLISGEKREIKIDPGYVFDAGNIVWSPDSKSLTLTLAINPCAGVYGISKTVWAESTTILLVDVKTLEQKILIKEDPRLFVTVEWNKPDKITITDGEENSLWYLNINTGEITRE